MKKLSRREFVMSTATVVALSPSILLTSRSVGAADMPKVELNDPQAKALSYAHESTNAENICANCQLYGAAADSAWGSCAIFPGKLVAGKGWCSAWVKQSG
jgi:hypothetical protein